MGLKHSGKIVKLKDDRIGRTFYNKGKINGKVPVYLRISETEFATDKAILCDPKGLRIVGYLD